MISCQAFRANLRPGSDDAAVLEHLRNCDACLEYAVSVDPDSFFRAIGGQELVPPGGVDAFAAEVMDQIRLRQAESSVARRFLIAPRRLAAAAVITATIGVAALVYDNAQKSVPPAVQPVAAVARPAQLATKPVVESYESQKATIVEVPDANVVMIFDESLPADL
jgi:predicted anti-sigma-YlaC factor YlaD